VNKLLRKHIIGHIYSPTIILLEFNHGETKALDDIGFCVDVHSVTNVKRVRTKEKDDGFQERFHTWPNSKDKGSPKCDWIKVERSAAVQQSVFDGAERQNQQRYTVLADTKNLV
jgi:hypothetical protein